MTIKLNSLSRWRPYVDGEVLALPGDDAGERRIRLSFNCERETAVFLRVDDADALVSIGFLSGERLLAVVGPGVETVEFASVGTVEFFCVPRLEGAQVWFQTADDEPTFSRVVDPRVFTRIANRRHRNPEMEAMMQRMQVNIDRRLAMQAAEFEAALERRRKEDDNGRPSETIVSNAPGTAAGLGGEEVRAPDAGAGEEPSPAGGADGGE